MDLLHLVGMYLICFYAFLFIAPLVDGKRHHMGAGSTIYWLMPILFPIFLVCVLLGCAYYIIILVFVLIGLILNPHNASLPQQPSLPIEPL